MLCAPAPDSNMVAMFGNCSGPLYSPAVKKKRRRLFCRPSFSKCRRCPGIPLAVQQVLSLVWFLLVVANFVVGLVFTCFSKCRRWFGYPVETNVIVGLAFTCCNKCRHLLGFLPVQQQEMYSLVWFLLKQMSLLVWLLLVVANVAVVLVFFLQQQMSSLVWFFTC